MRERQFSVFFFFFFGGGFLPAMSQMGQIDLDRDLPPPAHNGCSLTLTLSLTFSLTHSHSYPLPRVQPRRKYIPHVAESPVAPPIISLSESG
jgi:hypothetical protein